MTWADAARYCNWLSEQHDIPQEEYCFVIESDGSVHLADRYLHKRGFRLPTEAEWSTPVARAPQRDATSAMLLSFGQLLLVLQKLARAESDRSEYAEAQ